MVRGVSFCGYEGRTRLILIASPRDDPVVDSFGYGC